MKKLLLTLVALLVAAGSMTAQDYISTQEYNRLRQLAEKENDAEAQYALGNYFYQGMVKGFSPSDLERGAAQYWAMARSNHHPEGTGNLAYCYRYGYGVVPDTVRAIQLYVESIDLGNTSLIDQIERNARGGSGFDALILYDCATKGIGMEKNQRLATEYLTIAADDGDQRALLALGNLLYKNKDYEGALARYSAIANPTPGVLYRIAELNLNSTPAESMEQLLNLAYDGYVPAMEQLGLAYYNGYAGAPDMAEAAKWNRRAAAGGSHASAWKLASQLINGWGVDQNYEQAIYFLEMAMPSGYHVALRDSLSGAWAKSPFVDYLISRAYAEGGEYDAAEKVLKNMKKFEEKDLRQAILAAQRGNGNDAFKKIKKMADKKKSYAYAPLASLYLNGQGTDKSATEALKWAVLAADAGDPFGMCLAGDIYAGMKKWDDAVHFYEMAYEQGILTPTARENYVRCLSKGLGCTENADLAKAVKEAVPAVKLVDLYTVVRDEADKGIRTKKK